MASELTNEVGNMALVEDIINACVATAKAGKLRLHEGGGQIYATRCQLHALFIMPFGSGKGSLIVNNVAESVGQDNCVTLTDFTEPGLLGTITKDGRYLDGAAVLAAQRGLLLCDEIQKLSRRAREALLRLLEEQQYARGLGYSVPYPIIRDGDGYSVRVEKGLMSIEARFSSVFAGLYISKRRLADLALFSRFIPIIMQTDVEDAYELVKGKRRVRVKAKPVSIGDVEFPSYLRYVDRHRAITARLSFKADPGFYARNVLNVARIAASFAIRDGFAEVSDEHYERALNFVPLSLYNCVASTLTLTEYRVLSVFYSRPGIPQARVAELLGLSDRQVRNCVARLRNLGLMWGGQP